VDYLYPRITAEQSLANIDDSSRVSSEKLAELDEKIGHRLQEAMQQASTSIREGMEHSLNTILGPAIEKLVNNAHSGSEKALESLLERFMESVGSAGNAQKDMMQNASQEMKVATEAMAAGLNSFVGNLESQFERMVKQNESTLTGVQSALSQKIEEQQENENARQRLLNDQMKGVQTTQQTLTEGIESVVEHQKIQHQELVSELNQLLAKFGLLSESHAAATDNMRQVSGDMKASANQLGLLSANIKESVDFLGQDLEKSIAQVQLLSEQNTALVSKFDGLTNQLGSAGQQVELAARQLDSAAGKAESGLSSVERHFEQLGHSLTTHVQQLEQQVAALLTEYSNQVHAQTTRRMDTWNENTNSYISSMTDAIQALSGVVDEIDGKIRA
jgi:phage-related protein